MTVKQVGKTVKGIVPHIWLMIILINFQLANDFFPKLNFSIEIFLDFSPKLRALQGKRCKIVILCGNLLKLIVGHHLD